VSAPRLGDERGVALLAALSVLLILSVLAGAVLAQGASFRGQSTAARDGARALAAAEAGLEVARHRLNLLSVDDAKCLTDAAVAPGTGGAAAGECPSYSGALGNGATYRYTVTPVLPENDHECGPLPLTGTLQRCITAAGTMNGVTRRVQLRVDSHQVGIPVFPMVGALGLDHIHVNGSSTTKGTLGTNGNLQFAGSSTVQGGCLLGPTATVTAWGTLICTQTREPTKFAVTPPDSLDVQGRTFANTATTNDDAKLGSGYTASTRSLVINNGQTLTIPSGVYNLCSLSVYGSANIATGSSVMLFIDSPARRGSGCPSGSGRIQVNGSLSNANSLATSLQIFVYGTNVANPTIDVQFNGSATILGALYAPNSVIQQNGALSWKGAMVLWQIDVNGAMDMTNEASVTDIITTQGQTVFRDGNWRECASAPSNASDPESGCT
jgi:hypothetical protein